MEIPDVLEPLLWGRYRSGLYSPLLWGRHSMYRSGEPIAIPHDRDAYDLYGPRWGSSPSVYRTDDGHPINCQCETHRADRPYIGVPLDDSGYIVANQPFYHTSSGATLVLVPPPAGSMAIQSISEVFDPVNGERIGKVPGGGYNVKVIAQGESVSDEVGTESGAQKPSPDVASPATLTVWDWLKQPVTTKIPVPKGVLVAVAGILIGYYVLK